MIKYNQPRKNMATDNNNSNVEVISTTETVTVSEQEKPEVESKETSVKEVENSELKVEQAFDEKVKATLSKIRDERDEADKLRKAAETRTKQLEEELKVRDEKEAEAKGDYKKLWETKTEEVLNVSTEKRSLEEKLNTLTASNKETVDTLSNALNKMIDANIKNWPDKAKNLVDSTEEASPQVRLGQFIKANDLVSDIMKESPNPGVSPSPKDVSEQGNDGKKDIVARFNRQKASGIYGI